MKISKTIQINASVDDVWTILGPNYTQVGDWASSVYASGARAGIPKVADAPAAGRICQTSLGPFTETIETYDAERHHVAYTATGDKMPGFVKRLVNAWSVHPSGSGSRVEMKLSAELAFPFNLLMGPMMRMQFSKVLQQATEELKHYAETGTPHPRKTKIDASKKAVEARAALAV